MAGCGRGFGGQWKLVARKGGDRRCHLQADWRGQLLDRAKIVDRPRKQYSPGGAESEGGCGSKQGMEDLEKLLSADYRDPIDVESAFDLALAGEEI